MRKLYIFLLLLGSNMFGQTIPSEEINLSPEGLFDKVFDHYGNSYKLSDILIGQEIRDTNNQLLRATSPVAYSCGYYNLYFETGSGMEDISNPDHAARRAVLCQVLTDLSNFINTPLTTNGLNNKVNIWVRNINNVVTNPNELLGLATSFYTMPYNTTTGFGGIVDNEIWKTIHLGKDSYTNVVSPLISNGITAGQSGIFYHGMMAFNFSDPAINWNTNLNNTSFSNLFDLYSVVLHEMTHALGFASLINSSGGSELGVGYNYFSRYDTKLKNNVNTQFLIKKQSNACGSMYNYVFNNLVNTTVLQPSSNSCSDKIRYVGLSNVPVHTPTPFSPFSSLSHFEGGCVTPNQNFVMESEMGEGVIRRFLEPQERDVLGDLGYSVNTNYNFGFNTTFLETTTYTGTLLGISAAGMNDGINSDDTFSYTGYINSNISLNGILSNDINASGFECLQDIFTPNSYINHPAGDSSTNIIFSSSSPGLHLLRYVPVNGDQKGNITYIYVHLKSLPGIDNCSPTPSVCDLIMNGDFSEVSTIVSSFNQLHLACGWSRANLLTPDYYNSNAISSILGIPCNLFGFQNDFNNLNGYAGMSFYRTPPDPGIPHYESIKTKLKAPLLPNTTYQLSFKVSLAEGRSSNAIKFQAFFSPTEVPTTASSGNLQIDNYNMLKQSQNFSTISNDWENITMIFNTSNVSGEEYLYLGALNDPEFTSITPANPVIGCNHVVTNPSLGQIVYYYIDNVSLIPLNGGSFNLPSTLCKNQSITDLSTYLEGLPGNGVFSGSGVINNGGTYSLNSNFNLSLGSKTITYTYTNSSGCQVSIYSNINIIFCDSVSCPSTLTFNSPELETSATYQASNTITASTNYIVSEGSTISFIAGNSILLSPLTVIEVDRSSEFIAKIEACSETQTRIIEEEQLLADNEQITLFPNPTNETITISSKESFLKNVIIYSVDGKMVFKQDFEKTNSCQLNVLKFRNGVYLVVIETEEGKIFREKMIKN